MLRAARFVARFELVPDSALVKAVHAMHDRLKIVSAERIRDELDKLVVVRGPHRGFHSSSRPGWHASSCPSFRRSRSSRTRFTVTRTCSHTPLRWWTRQLPERLLRLACLLHDVGKPKTRAFGPEGVTFHHHEVVGARMVRDRMTALRYSSADIDVVSRLVELHLRFHTYRMGWTDRAVRRYVRDAGPLLDRLNELTRCDCTTRDRVKAQALERRMDELDAADRRATRTGGARLDQARPRREAGDGAPRASLPVPPSEKLSPTCSRCGSRRVRSDEDEVMKRLDAWWAARQLAGVRLIYLRRHRDHSRGAAVACLPAAAGRPSSCSKTSSSQPNAGLVPGSHRARPGRARPRFLSILGGLERPQTGQVVVEGRDLARCSGDDLASFRRRTVGFVFQHFGLLDTATALENVELALSLSRCDRRTRRRKAADLLGRVGLGDRLTHRPAELSGGERQRVGMARALANDPELILADEPTGNLDGVDRSDGHRAARGAEGRARVHALVGDPRQRPSPGGPSVSSSWKAVARSSLPASGEAGP